MVRIVRASSRLFRAGLMPLDRVSDALIAGHPVPPDLTDSLSTPIVSPTVYR